MKNIIMKKRKALARHFGVKLEYVTWCIDDYEDEFDVKIGQTPERVECVTFEIALSRTYESYGIREVNETYVRKNEISYEGIGNYWYMAGSKYLFRWM